MLSYIKELLAEDEKLREFLMWVNHKASSVETSYKPFAVRAYYFILELDFSNPELNNYDFNQQNLRLDYNLNLSLRLSFILARYSRSKS